jgi:hypothetical protein
MERDRDGRHESEHGRHVARVGKGGVGRVRPASGGNASERARRGHVAQSKRGTWIRISRIPTGVTGRTPVTYHEEKGAVGNLVITDLNQHEPSSYDQETNTVPYTELRFNTF